MNRSLIASQVLIASSAVLCQSAEAGSTYVAPDSLASSTESRIKTFQTGDWSSLLNPADSEGELVAKSRWDNGSNKFWEHCTLASSETNPCRFGTQIPVQVPLERFEARPPLTPQPTH